MAEPATAQDRVSTLELFFDLVFVFTITQVALIVEHHPSWSAAAQALLELLVIYWMYGGFAWLTNTLGTATSRQRIVLLIGMAAFFIVSLAVPRAFTDDGIAFGVAYLVLNAVHLGGFLLRGTATMPAMLRIGQWNLLAATLILIAGFVHGGGRWPLWIAAVAVQYLPPLVTRTTGSFDIGIEHFAERHGLMVIIVLGESLVSVALAATELPVNGPLVVGTLCGLAASAAFWWAYFGGDDEAGADGLRRRPAERRGWWALVGYDLPTVLMLAAIVSVAAGSRLSLPELVHPTSLAAASFIGGGAALYLAALALFRAALASGPPLPRAVVAALLVATIPLGTQFGAAQQLITVAIVVALLLVAERRGLGRRRTADRAGWRP
jgi:low temperature requirement protein LtrA